MCGYTSYRDPRLIPPDVNDAEEESDIDSFVRCRHGMACLHTWMRANGVGEAHTGVVAGELECCYCPLWEEE